MKKLLIAFISFLMGKRENRDPMDFMVGDIVCHVLDRQTPLIVIWVGDEIWVRRKGYVMFYNEKYLPEELRLLKAYP